MPTVMARHREHTNGWLWVLPSLVIPLIVAAVAWTFHVSSEGEQVAPNVRFAGIDISGLSPSAAATEVETREEDFLETPVIIDLGESRVILTAEEIGFDYLYGDTLADVVSARHGEGPWDEFLAWASTPFETVTVEDRFALNVTTARQRLAGEDFVIEAPVEPVLSNEDASYMYAIPGTNGVTVDVDQVVAELVEADIAAGTIEVIAEHATLPPTVTDDQARAAALAVNDETRPGILAVVGDHTAQLSPGQVRSHLVSTVDDGSMEISVDVEGLKEELESAFPEPIGAIVPPVLEVVDGVVVVKSVGVPPPICCSLESVERVAAKLLDGGSTFYQLETRPSDDPEVVAWADGSAVTEPVATFTTNHPCCEGRVTNIQTMADFIRGKYLIPGETFSVNDYVGPRTRDKGYVSAGAIRSGYMTEELGGGVSQFITTLFNASFFGGLDLDEYQSHSIYFSRYPFGREATLSIPGPDLKVTNNTDYPVLIWPTYDDNSITVTLYSTPNVEVEELDQRVSYYNQCRHSEIDRQRTFADGRVEIDTIVANYRPGDGIDCNGRQIPQTP
jgi:vancomycin resistance protein YoaR